MKRLLLLLLISTLAFSLGSLPAQEKDKKDRVILPPGMEIKKFGDIGILAPKDSQVHMDNNRVAAESAIEYAARKFLETQEHLLALEAKLNELKKELEELRKDVLKMQKESNKQDK